MKRIAPRPGGPRGVNPRHLENVMRCRPLLRWLLLPVLVMAFAALLTHRGQTRNAGPTPPPAAARPASARYVPDAQELRQAYKRAAQVAERTKGRVFKAKVEPHWLDNNSRFWYRNDLRGGATEFILVDAEKGSRGPAFDHPRLAEALSKAAGTGYQADRLPFRTIEFVEGGKAVRFRVGEAAWQCDLASYECSRVKKDAPAQPAGAEPPAAPPEAEGEAGGDEQADEEDPPQQKKKGMKKPPPRRQPNAEVRSPDRKWTALVKDHNVWLRDAEGKETRLTDNGVAGNTYGYFAWSPDSQTLVAYRTEPGDDKLVYLIETSPRDQLRAKLHQRVYPQPGDKYAAHEMWLFDVGERKPVRVDAERIDEFRGVPRLRWSKDSRRFTYERADRGHQRFRVIEVEAATGTTRHVIDEKADTFIWTAHLPRTGLAGVAVRYLEGGE